MNEDLLAELYTALDEADANPSVRTVILTGSGRGFCSGMDLKGGGPPTPAADGMGRIPSMFTTQQRIAGVVARMRKLRKPIIAAINGAAAGGGLALVLASDIRIATPAARFNAAFVRVGLSGCDLSVSWLLPRLVGAAHAHLLMLTGRLIDASEAHRIGMLADIVNGDSLMDKAYELADEIAANSPFGVWMTKEVMWSALEIPGQQAAIDLENRTQILSAQTADAVEQRESFLNKTSPTYGWR